MGGKSKETTKSAQMSRTTPTYQQYATPIVKGLATPMMGAYEQSMRDYMSGTGFNPAQYNIWGRSGQEAQKYGAEGPYAQAANQYLAPTMGEGWNKQLNPYFEAQRKEIQGALPSENAAFWQGMKREMGPMWGRSGRAADQTAEAYGKLRMGQAERMANIAGQQGQATQQGMQWSGSQAGNLANLRNPLTWGQQALSWAGAPEAAIAENQRMAQQSALPWAQQLAALAGMGYQFPQYTEEAGGSRSTTSGSQGGLSCCFIFMEGNKLTEYIRRYRDAYFPKHTSIVSKGYRRLATWLVPKMRQSRFVRELVIMIMLHPLAKFAEAHYTNKRGTKMVLYPLALGWELVYRGIGLAASTTHLMDWNKYYQLAR